ncbi:MAG: DUF4432 family protein [Planctomycetes bacterium]|nr:DUF4432 family protein [Planctomycetota bacterium]
MPRDTCRIREHRLPPGYRAVTLENQSLSVTLLPEKGAEIHSLVYKPQRMDVLWKSPWGLKNLTCGLSSIGAKTEAAWLDHYAGGWQEILPNGGDACSYKGAPLGFHGEASTLPWDYTVTARRSTRVAADFCVRLFRSPFVLRRSVSVHRYLPAVLLSERLTNEAEEDMHLMWGHHPAYGAPFLGGDCRIQMPGSNYQSHEVPISKVLRIPAGSRGAWPVLPGSQGQPVDLRVVPGPDQRCVEFGYLSDFQAGWYGLVNHRHGFGIGLAWPREVFPYVWLWQELRGSFGYPWYGRCYVMALEPFTSMPGTGLVKAIERDTAPLLRPGQSLEVELAAVFFAGDSVLKEIRTDGSVEFSS